MSIDRTVVVSRREGERHVALRFEQSERRVFLSVASAWGTADHQREVAFLTELHLELFLSDVPHRIGLNREPNRRQYLDMISMEPRYADQWLEFVYKALMATSPALVH